METYDILADAERVAAEYVDGPAERGLLNWPRFGGPIMDRRGQYACPTCDDGILTIEHPIRCRECYRAGLGATVAIAYCPSSRPSSPLSSRAERSRKPSSNVFGTRKEHDDDVRTMPGMRLPCRPPR